MSKPIVTPYEGDDEFHYVHDEQTIFSKVKLLSRIHIPDDIFEQGIQDYALVYIPTWDMEWNSLKQNIELDQVKVVPNFRIVANLYEAQKLRHGLIDEKVYHYDKLFRNELYEVRGHPDYDSRYRTIEEE